ncbi:MAG: 23S rRNA (guanosine(2251)-2'-O)-methyltransferase RlmB [Gammaproteobacteria bacterium]|jgi:23S rRNA (guanosine2251-2'-O)-methyltransferase|nr:23S rRNA (guanosine(2251)-2'-O)-methyltransferase RlmB [Gammaproteobacteria bacterium]
MADRVIYGINSVLKALERRARDIRRVFLEDGGDGRRHERVARAAAAAGVTLDHVGRDELIKLTGTAKHQGVAARVAGQRELDDHAALALIAGLTNPLVLVLDGVEDPRNFGAILRTADAAGVDLVVTGRSRGVALTPVVSKVASGAAETQALARVANLARFLRALRAAGVRTVGTDEAGTTAIFDVSLTGPLALIMGGEGKGLRRLTREHCDALVRVPMLGAVESLNVSVAAGVCVYEAIRQRRPGPA